MWDWIDVIKNWLSALGPYALATLAWSLLALGSLGGLAGVFVPVIPGAFVLFLAALLHKWMLPEFLTWWTILGLFGFVVLDRVVDFSGTALGAKWFGGSKWGIIGALVGGLFGLLFGIIGLVIGPIVGAFAFEMLAANSAPKEAARSGMGAGVGFGISAMGRLIVCGAMLLVIFLDALINPEASEAETEGLSGSDSEKTIADETP